MRRAREICDQHLVAGDANAETELGASRLISIPELAAIPFDVETISLLGRLLGGQVTYYPNYVARLNRFTEWHVDNGFLPAYHAEADHLYDPEFRHLQCVIYLQDNEPGYGGGLDVVPGSHLWAERGIEPTEDALFAAFGQPVEVGTRAGDLLVFDGRLLHRGSVAIRERLTRKYGVFWSASRTDDVQVARYLSYLAGRSDHLRELGLGEGNMDYMVSRYDDLFKVRFPWSYLPESLAVAEACDLRLAELTRV